MIKMYIKHDVLNFCRKIEKKYDFKLRAEKLDKNIGFVDK